MWNPIPLLLALVCGNAQGVAVARQDEPGELHQGQVLCFYEVRDLVAKMLPESESTELGLVTSPPKRYRMVPTGEDIHPPAGLEPPAAEEPTQEQLERSGAILEELLKTYVDPPLAGPTETLRVIKGSTLVASARPQQQKWIEDFLVGLRDEDGRVELQARFYAAPRGLLREQGIAPSATLETAEELQAFLKRLEADERVQCVNAPRLISPPCYRASISVVNQIAFIKSWHVAIVEPDAQEIADPEVATIQEGLVLDERTTPLPGGRFGLQIEASRCEVPRPIPTRKVRVSASVDQEVEIGEPDIKTAHFSASVLLADGASAVLVTPDTDLDKDLALVVTVRRVQPTEEGARKH